jgi:hypothetical protein
MGPTARKTAPHGGCVHSPMRQQSSTRAAPVPHTPPVRKPHVKKPPEGGFFQTTDYRLLGSSGSSSRCSFGSSGSGVRSGSSGSGSGGSFHHRSGGGSGGSFFSLLAASGQGSGGDHGSQQQRLFHAFLSSNQRVEQLPVIEGTLRFRRAPTQVVAGQDEPPLASRAL